MMNKSLKIILPILLLVAAVVISWLLITQKPKVVHKPVEVKHPLVSVMEAEPQTVSIPVFTRGTVTPGTEIQLVSEVAGQVLSISENFANGGFFRKGDELIRIDPVEYNVNIKRAEARKAQALQALLQAKAEMKARQRVRGGNRSRLATYEVQLKQAQANYAAAKAEQSAAVLQKQRTRIKAPFDGRVRIKAVSQGQFVRPGIQLGSIYAVDSAEVRLPLSDRQVGLVDVPLNFDNAKVAGTSVTLMGEYGGEKYYWPGEIVRSEGGLDERNRLLYIVARVDSPYRPDASQPGRPPLASGFFVEAQIKGKTHENLFVMPRRALRNSNQVWIVDAQNQLRRRQVEVLYKGKTNIYIKSGLQAGDRVVLSQLNIAVNGMKVRVKVKDTDPAERRQDQNLLGDRSEPAAETPAPSAQQDAKKTAVIKQFSASELRELAKDVKQVADTVDEKSRQQLAAAAGKLSNVLAKAVKPPTDTAPPANEPQAASPLAAVIEADMQQDQPAVKTEAMVAQNEVPTTKNTVPTKSQSQAVVTKAQAPAPLTEALQ